MMAMALIRTAMNMILGALTVQERWDAARSFKTDVMTERWFIMTGVAAIIVLTAALLVVSYNRMERERRLTGQLFAEYAHRRGLSQREQELMLEIAANAGLSKSASIFTLTTAFDRGAAKIVEETLAQKGLRKSAQLRTELSFLREKLGFQKQRLASIGASTKSTKLSSRQIPTGKTVLIRRLKSSNPTTIEASVTNNSDLEFVVKMPAITPSRSGEQWRVRYCFGASVWEFDTTVISSRGDCMLMNHSDSVRFINRRRFLRVGVDNRAFVACFPFTQTATVTAPGFELDPTAVSSEQVSSMVSCSPPEFVPAVIKELGGPGLLVEAALKVKVGDRILVVFELTEPIADDLPIEGMKTSQIVEDIGIVRHCVDLGGDLSSLAIELTGLSDSNVNELIRITNAASIRANIESKDVVASGSMRSAEADSTKVAVM